jgi:hypothetical protein
VYPGSDASLHGYRFGVHSLRMKRMSSNAPNPKLQNLVFHATISVPGTANPVGDLLVPLSPGMSVAVEIKTGEPRFIDAVLSPIRALA